MATPGAALHRDVEQEIRDLKDAVRRLSNPALRIRGTNLVTINPGPGIQVEDDDKLNPTIYATTQFHTDEFVASTPGAQTLVLTYAPLTGSVHVYWNGIWQPLTEWTRVENVITLADPSGLIAAGDGFSVAYSHDELTGVGAVIVPNFRDAAPQALNAWTIPAAAEIGDLLVGLAMMPTTESVDNLNGWVPAGASDYVTHSAIGPGTRTYRLEVYYFINDGSAVPTCTNVAAQDVVCSMVAFENGATVEAVFDTLADGTAANAPALSPVSLRAFGTIGDTVTITPGRGTEVLSTNYSEIDTVLTIDQDPTPAPATASGAAGWCLSSLVVRA